MALSSSLRVASSSRSSSVDPREVIGRLDRPAQLWLALGFVEEADQQQLLAVALHRMDLDADRDRHCRRGSPARP